MKSMNINKIKIILLVIIFYLSRRNFLKLIKNYWKILKKLAKIIMSEKF